jgi:argininosuccinate lyase
MQEDKTPLFDTVKTVRECLFIFAHLLVHTKYNVNRFENELSADLLTATDLAEYLVEKGVPFRQAHSCTGKIISYSIEHKKDLHGLTLQEYRNFSDVIDEDVYSVLHPRASIERKISAGSTSPHEVKKQIVYWTRHLKNRITKKTS